MSILYPTFSTPSSQCPPPARPGPLFSFRMSLHIEIQVQASFLSFSSLSTLPLGLQLIQLIPNLRPYHLFKLHALSPPLSPPSLPKGQNGRSPFCLLLWEVSLPNLPRTCMNMGAESANSRGSSLYFLAFLTLPANQTESLCWDQATALVR